MRELRESGVPKKMAQSYIYYDLMDSDFRKVLCSRSEAMFKTIAANTRGEYQKLSEIEPLKREINFDETIIPPERPLEAFINSGTFKFGINFFCDLDEFKKRFREFVRENICVRERWCPEYYSETFENMGLIVLTRRIIYKSRRQVIIQGIDFKS